MSFLIASPHFQPHFVTSDSRFQDIIYPEWTESATAMVEALISAGNEFSVKYEAQDIEIPKSGLPTIEGDLIVDVGSIRSQVLRQYMKYIRPFREISLSDLLIETEHAVRIDLGAYEKVPVLQHRYTLMDKFEKPKKRGSSKNSTATSASNHVRTRNRMAFEKYHWFSESFGKEQLFEKGDATMRDQNKSEQTRMSESEKINQIFQRLDEMNIFTPCSE